MHLRNYSRAFCLVGSAFVFGAALTAQAAVVPLGGGWQAEWDPGLDPFVDIVPNPNNPIGDAVFIQKSAEFTQPPVGGIFPSIPIVFRQVDANAVHNIVIDDEIITNNTGVDWTDFHLTILNGPDAAFDPVATMNSGGPPPIGWYIAPFTQAAFTPDNMRLDIRGGTVPASPAPGSVWFPGNGPANGQLWINVNPQPQAPFTVFTLKEQPTPEPATLALLAMGAVIGLRRRR